MTGKRKLFRATSPSAVSEARFDRRMMSGQAAPARFRYSDLKEAGRGCGDVGPMGIELDGGVVSRSVGLLPRGTEDSGGACSQGRTQANSALYAKLAKVLFARFYAKLLIPRLGT